MTPPIQRGAFFHPFKVLGLKSGLVRDDNHFASSNNKNSARSLLLLSIVLSGHSIWKIMHQFSATFYIVPGNNSRVKVK